MSSKPKSKTFIVLHYGTNWVSHINVALGRYRVGARNGKEAEELLKKLIGKHVRVRVYYEEKEKTVGYGVILKE